MIQSENNAQFYEPDRGPEAIKLLLLDIFKEIHHKMANDLPYKDILDRVFELLGKIIPFDRMGIAVLDDQSQKVTLKWVKSKMPIKNLETNYSVSINQTSLIKIIQSGKHRIINDLEEYYAVHPNSLTTKYALEDGIRSNLTCPLKLGGKSAGVVFFSSSVPFTYSKNHVNIYFDISEGLSLILEKEILKENIMKGKR